MATWPAGLPFEVVQEGTGIVRLTQSPIRTEMEDGPGRARRRSTTTWSEVNMRLALSPVDLPAFQTFLRVTLDHGASRFTMRVWKPGLTAPYPEKTVRLREDPQIDAEIPWIFITLPLLVRDY